MREFDDYGLRICRYQGKLFEESLRAVDCSTPVFIRRFMFSKMAERMDRYGFMYESLSERDAIAEIEEQYGKSDYGKIRYGREEMYWIGYLYRYWAYTREVGSRMIYRKVKPSELEELYYPYHSLDPAQAVERILEAKGLDDGDMIKRGVEILRRLRGEKPRSNAGI